MLTKTTLCSLNVFVIQVLQNFAHTKSFVPSSDSSSKINEKPSIDTTTPPVAVKDTNKAGDDDEEEDIEVTQRRRARKKSMEDGIRVVSAFEGQCIMCVNSLLCCMA